jgi:hypothetical protein
MHEAKEVNLIDPLWGLETDSTSCLGDCLRIKMLLHKIQPLFRKSADVSLYAYVENICVGFYTASDPFGPVHHDLPIGYFKLASGLDGDQNGNDYCMETMYCLGQVASIIHQSQSPVYIQC